MTDKQSMSTLEVLERARALIERPERWNDFSVGATKNGKSTGAFSSDVYSSCARGAICRAIGTYSQARETPVAIAIMRALRKRHKGDPVSWLCAWNNSHTHPEVLAAFDRAIASQRAKEKGVS